MAVHLLDVNVLLALGWATHLHHAGVHAWFTANAPAGWATCPITQCGFVRLSSNRRAVPQAISPPEAVWLLDGMVRHPNDVFWPDDVALAGPGAVGHERIVGHQQVTDAYLLGLARRHGGRLATLDSAIRALVPPDDADLATFIPV